jgi:hypothetical protein
MKEEDIYIKLLEYGETKSMTGICFIELVDVSKKHGYLTPEEYDSIKNHILYVKNINTDKLPTAHYKFLFFHSFIEENFKQINDPMGDFKYLFKTESFFKLIEHKELKLARKNSKEAKRQSYIAVGFSLFAIIASLVLGVIQIKTESNISKGSFKPLEVAMDSLYLEYKKNNEKEVFELMKINKNNQTSLDTILQFIQVMKTKKTLPNKK